MTGPLKDVAGNDYARQALLPEGLRDQLVSEAEQEDSLVRSLVDTFLSHGYDRVSPPLVEYEDSLLSGTGATGAAKMFRIMDADTQRMMAVRCDMTTQLARLANTRFADSPRPLRLAYAGSVLRTKGSQIRPARQFTQAGIELVGCPSLEGELEVIALAVEAVAAVGITDLTIDLTVAPLTGLVCKKLGLTGEDEKTVLAGLEAKDTGAFSRYDSAEQAFLQTLISAAGPADNAVKALKGLNFSGEAAELVMRLETLVSMLAERMPELSVTVDPCETYGFEYKSGIGFALFSRSGNGELGRGGRYLVNDTEEATGFSVYLDSLMATLPKASGSEKVFLPYGTETSVGAGLRADGHRTISGLTDAADSRQEAARLGCSHIYENGAVSAL